MISSIVNQMFITQPRQQVILLINILSLNIMKKQKTHAKMFLLTGLLILTTKVFSQDPNFYIYLCFGQSNMEGQGKIEEQDKTVDSRFQVMEAVDCSNLGRTKDSWYPATPPLCRCWSGLSPADYFGRTMVANLPDSIKVGVVNVSVAGCKIELFDKDNYQDYVSTVTEDWLINIINAYDGNPYGYLVDIAKLAQKDGVIKGILLHQGESNTGDNEWPSKVKGVYDSLIFDLGLNADSVPLLAGEVVHADQGGVCASMNSIIATLPDTIPNSYVISSSGCPAASDNLHFNSLGYRRLGARYAVQMLSLLGYDIEEPEFPDPLEGTDSVFFEPECATIGEEWDIVSDANASNGSYVMVQSGLESVSEASTDSASAIYITFSVENTATYNLFARVNCPTADDDSYWVKMDDGDFEMFNGLGTSGWQWLNLNSYSLTSGEHTLTITYREDGAKLDKICIADFSKPPTGMGGTDENCEPLAIGKNLIEAFEGYSLGQNYPNPFNEKTSISFEIPDKTYVSLKVFNMIGVEIAELGGKEFNSGKHTVEFASGKLLKGHYFYMIIADKFSATRKMIKLTE